MTTPCLRANFALASMAAALCLAVGPARALGPAPQSGALAQEGRPIHRIASSAAATARPGVAGRYAPLRDGGRDTGCMITLEPGGRAQLAPACRDQGLVIFDPVRWALEQGKLSLTARKGHKAHFDRQTDGIWQRDPKEGKALALRPI